MSFSRIHSAQTYLLKGQIINVETDISRGLNSYAIVGLADKSVDESKDRVSGAIKNIGFESPKQKNQKTVVSLAPSDVKKEGGYFDLAIALGYMLASGDIEFDPKGKVFIGELGLDGELRPVKGVLPIAETAKKKGFTEIFLPKENVEEAGLVEGLKVFGAKNLKEVVNHFEIETDKKDTKKSKQIQQAERTKIIKQKDYDGVDFSDIKGQESAKRALEIAAAGGHNIAMYGPPGTGKTMLAKAFTYLLPDLDEEEIFEVTSIHSIAGTLKGDIITRPPFRSPHHTSSYVSIIGGGTFPKPGEVTLAHKGVLFLDEFPEFEKRVIESMRQPLEDKIVTISRAKGTTVFPSEFTLVAAMNPCPCGYLGSKNRSCICRQNDIDRYKRKMSGPIMDRIDIWVPVSEISYERLSNTQQTENVSESEKIKERIQTARNLAIKRYSNSKKSIKNNGSLGPKEIEQYLVLKNDVKKLFDSSAEKLALSARGYHRVLKLARTIADMAGTEEIEIPHILEALQYRPKITVN